MFEIMEQNDSDGKLTSSEIPRLNIDGLPLPDLSKKKLKALKNVHAQVVKSQIDETDLLSKDLRDQFKSVKRQIYAKAKEGMITDLEKEIKDRKIHKALKHLYCNLPVKGELEFLEARKVKDLTNETIEIMKDIMDDFERTKKMSTKD